MKLTIVAMEMPYPPNHGGRIDIWRRIVALSRLGVDIQLICWDYAAPSEDIACVIREHVKDFILIEYSSGIGSAVRRCADLLKYPLQVTSRIIRGSQKEQLLKRVENFQPDVILSDHVHCGLLAQQISKALTIPFVIRSHDIEHLHYGYWLKAAKGVGKLKLALCLWHLKSYEFSMFRESWAFYDISVDDLEFWRGQGLTNGKFLPPLIDGLDQEPSQPIGNAASLGEDKGVPTYDIVFMGNLRTENNVFGVIWFLHQVLPKIKAKMPAVRVLIAGSSPVPELERVCQEVDGVTLIANPVSADDIYRSGKVFVNPVASGSGTSIKSVDMLTLDRPIITLPKGIQGLPQSARKYFRVASDSDSFSELVCSSLMDFDSFSRDHDEINELFGYPVIESFISDLQSLLKTA
jgi:polysaccharide biosynthesis protein PslH